MSGPEETFEPTATPGTDDAAPSALPGPAAPPSFGNAGGAHDRPTDPEQFSGPESPWWERETMPPAVPEEPPTAPADRPGTLVAGPGVHALDTRGAVPREPVSSRVPSQGTDSRFTDTEPDGIPILARADGPAVPGEAFGGSSAAVATSAGMATPPEAAPVFEMSPHAAPAAPPFGPRTGPSWAGRPAPAETGEPLIPDAILPPGTSPGQTPHAPAAAGGAATASVPPVSRPHGAGPHGPGPHGAGGPPQAGQAPPVIGPMYRTEGATPPAGGPPAATAGGRGDRRRLLLVGGGVVAGLVIASAAFVGLSSGDDSAGPATTAAPTTAQSTGAQPASPEQTPATNGAVAKIDNERTDRRPLTFIEVFPSSKITLARTVFTQDKISVNHQCELAARGAMATALERGGCRSVVRATYVNGKKYAITTGVAVMPTRTAAVTASKAGDPSRYEWFRGMRGKVATKIDQAGGYAASTVRGRYIVYSYAQYVDGKPPKPGDATLRNLAGQFIAYALRPIDRRAR